MRAATLPTTSRGQAASRWSAWLLSPPSLLVLLMAAVVIVVPPLGEFPINDDWGRARMVQTLVERGRLELAAPTAATVVLQLFWGGLIAQLFGFSHTALRASTLVLAAAGVLGFYVLLRHLLDSRRALLGALLLQFNPLYFFLSYTFLSDVPFVALALWAMVCYVRAEPGRRAQTGWLAAGSTLAGAAYLVRQLGVALPLAALGSLLLAGGWRAALKPRHLAAVLGPFLPAVLIGASFSSQRGLARQEPLTWTLVFLQDYGVGVIGLLLARLAELSSTLGLLLLPVCLSAVIARSGFDIGGWRRWLAGALLLALAAGFVVHTAVFDQDFLFPHMRNILSPRGFLVSNNYYDDTFPESIVVPDWALVLVTVAAITGAGLLALTVVGALSRDRLRGPLAIPVLFGLVVLGLTVPYHRFLDRYLLALLPVVLLVALSVLGGLGPATEAAPARWGRALVVCGIVVLAVWSMSWEREYLERRGALWRAAETVMAQGIRPEQIDGGFEWNAWYRGQAAIAAAVQQVGGDRRGYRLEKRIHERLNGREARWVVLFAPPTDAPASRIVATVPYGRGQHVYAVQRF